jgi:hypothetical protein
MNKTKTKNNIDKYSFITYVAMKKKKYEKIQELLEYKIKQSGGSININVAELQNALLKVKVRLKKIENGQNKLMIDPYNKLSHLIESINTKVKKIEDEINEVGITNNLNSASLINRLNDIDTLVTNAADYKTVQTDRKLTFLREKVNPAILTGVIDSHIKDTSALVADLRLKLGGGKDLVNNEEITANIAEIESKIKEYDAVMEGVKEGPSIRNIIKEIEDYIKQMESLYEGNKEQIANSKLSYTEEENEFISPNLREMKFLLIDKNIANYEKKVPEWKNTEGTSISILRVPKSSETDKILVKTDSSDADEFSFYKESVVDKTENLHKGDETASINELVGTKFLEPKKVVLEQKKGGGGQDITIRSKDLAEKDLAEDELQKTLLPSIAIRQDKVNKVLKELYVDWEKKIKEQRESDFKILKYQLIYDELNIKKPKLDKLLFTYGSINEFITEDLKLKLQKLRPVLTEINEKLLNCTQLIKEFKESSDNELNKTLEPKCTSDDKFNLDILNELHTVLIPIRDKLKSTIDICNRTLTDKQFLEQVVKMKSPEQQQLENQIETKNNELQQIKQIIIDSLNTQKINTMYVKHLIELINSSTHFIEYIEKIDAIKDGRGNEAMYKIILNKLASDLKMNKKDPPNQYFNLLKQEGNKLYQEINNINKQILRLPKNSAEKVKANALLLKSEKEVPFNIIQEFLTKNEITSLDGLNKMSKYLSLQKGGNINQLGGIGEGKGAVKGPAKGVATKSDASDPPEETVEDAVVDGKKSHLNDFILKLSEFEMKIREMKMERRKVDKLIKKYNVRYTQFYNFQKYIVNYVSLILAQKEYEYWNLMSKGSISFYQSVLEKINVIINKFEDPLLFKDKSYHTEENMWFYTKHFFIIKILKQFMSELYLFWDIQDKKFKGNNNYNTPDEESLRDFIRQVREDIEKAQKTDLKAFQNITPDQIRLKAIKKFKNDLNKKNSWNLTYKIDTLADVKSDPSKPISINKNYFFLFNIFSSILDAYSSRLPPVANYMRINYNDMVRKGNETFVKNTKTNLLNQENKTLEKCLIEDDLKNKRPINEQKNKAIASAIENIQFAEVFDPDNFAENDALSMYMGLGSMLSKNKSVMLLTYGYSGVGKTFTLFGTKGVEGMLQSTLNNLTGNPGIEMKAFELYGLGVPYKFYWEKGNFSHKIFAYTIDTDSKSEKPNIFENVYFDKHNTEKYKQKKEAGLLPDEMEKSFDYILDKDFNYQTITREQIENFEGIVTAIDDIRKRNGRIKSTINNPESSRSIMIYDFKIKLADKNTPRLVVMDLPGKENLYETYCARETKYNEPHDIFLKHSPKPFNTNISGTPESGSQGASQDAPQDAPQPATIFYAQDNEPQPNRLKQTTPTGNESVRSDLSNGSNSQGRESISGSVANGSTVGRSSQGDQSNLTATSHVDQVNKRIAERKSFERIQKYFRDNSEIKKKLVYTKLSEDIKQRLDKMLSLNINTAKNTFDSDTYATLEQDLKTNLVMTGGAGTDDIEEIKPGQYSLRMIKAMMYINPLWLGLVPEIAQHFDLPGINKDNHLITNNNTEMFKLKTLNVYSTRSTFDPAPYQNLNATPGYIFNEQSYNYAHTATSLHAENKTANYMKTGLYGLTSRAIATITNFINENELEKLGEKINNMLSSQEARDKRYGYAGLEGIYINENILGLLEVLGKKIQYVKKPDRTSYASVVCVQPEIYKNEIEDSISGRTPITINLLEEKYKENGYVIAGSPALVQDNEFYSQLMCLKDIIRAKNVNLLNNAFTPSPEDVFNNFLRKPNFELKFFKTVKGITKDIHDNKNNWINSYDYNKIYNKSDPPIKRILAPYLDDDSFKNFYLFFVTSNNKKEDNDPSKDIDTCAKQIQLMYDTRYFMDVIANEDSKGIAGKCN